MRTTKILFLLLLLTNFSFSEEPVQHKNTKNNSVSPLGLKDCILVEKKNAHKVQKTTKKKIALKNVKINLEVAGKDGNDVKAIPKDKRIKFLLEDEKISNFLNDINKIALYTRDLFYEYCYIISIYDNEELIKSFQTRGNSFYDCETKTIYWSSENLLSKYWNITEEENACMAFDACP